MLLNAMILDPWKPTPVTRGRSLKVRSDVEPIMMGPIPRVQVNLPDDPDTATTAAPAVPIQETTSGTATQSAAERTRIRLPEAGAEGAPPVQKTKTKSLIPVTTTAETTSQTTTTSSARALAERVGDEAREDSQPVQMRRIAALMAECEDSSTSDDIAEARRTHPKKLTKVEDPTIKVVPRTDATTKPLTGRWVDTMHDDGAGESQVDDAWVRANAERKRGLLLNNAGDDATQSDVVRGSSERTRCSNRRLQRCLPPVTSEPRRNGEQSVEAELGPDYIGEAVSAIPGPQGSTESLGYEKRERSRELHANGAVTIRRLLVLSFRTTSRTS